MIVINLSHSTFQAVIPSSTHYSDQFPAAKTFGHFYCDEYQIKGELSYRAEHKQHYDNHKSVGILSHRRSCSLTGL